MQFGNNCTSQISLCINIAFLGFEAYSITVIIVVTVVLTDWLNRIKYSTEHLHKTVDFYTTAY